MHIRNRAPFNSAITGKISHSRPPWDTQVANCITDLHAKAREIEQTWRMRLHLPEKVRGGSSEGTAGALRNTVRLAAGGDDPPIIDDLRWISSWCRKAKIALGVEEYPKRLPRQFGESERKCPWCEHETLRQLANAGIVFCIDPACTDEEGRRPRAHLEWFDGEWVLRWQDQVIGTPE